ncbi:anthranilate synthase component I, partial [Hydrogenivirga sp. 128-5-R1-1]
MSINLSFEDFKQISREYNVIPLSKDIVSDIDTPLSVFLKVSSKDRFNFLFESVEQGENIGRYSFIGSSKPVYIRSKGNFIENYNQGKLQIKNTDDPLNEIKNLVKQFKPYKNENLPPFWGGLVGYVGYDIIHFYEPVEDIKPDTLKLPDIYFFLSDEVIAFDNVNKTIKIIVSAVLNKNDNVEEIYKKAIERINKIENLIQ